MFVISNEREKSSPGAIGFLTFIRNDKGKDFKSAIKNIAEF